MSDWLHIHRGDAPLIVAFPHTGTEIPPRLTSAFTSLWSARRDTDWWIDQLYALAADRGVTSVRTAVSRSVIDVNRDPTGASLYPGQATTELCPTTDFDGASLYRDAGPDDTEVACRRAQWFEPYHAALTAEIERLRAMHPRIVVYDAHSIRSRVPRLFDGELPQFNIGTNGGTTCDPALTSAVERICAASGRSHVTDARFRGGWTTRRYGRPNEGLHAIQMELAMRAYLDEPAEPDPTSWPPAFDPERVAPLVQTLDHILAACIAFAHEPLSQRTRP